jgi:hypothetical protein
LHCALIRRSTRISDGDLAFITKAVSAQAEECAAAWGIDPMTVAFYAKETNLPDGDVRVLSVVDDDGMAGTSGYHDAWAGVVQAQAQVSDRTSFTISHEVLEMMVNPHVNRWHTMPDGKRSTPREVCDACQSDAYVVDAEILGETRKVELSNYLLPSWFSINGQYPFDKMGKITAPFTMSQGGYLIIRDSSNNISNIFASGMPQRFAHKLTNPISRTLRIVSGNRGAETIP